MVTCAEPPARIAACLAWIVYFEARVERTPTCWLWRGHITTHGYGKAVDPFKRRPSSWAHRAAYEVFVGPIPDGLHLDHLCRVRHCVRPDHLEAVTHVVNAFRSRKTHCCRGHAFDAQNTYWEQDGRRRSCRACHAIREAARRRPSRIRERQCVKGHPRNADNIVWRERKGVRRPFCRPCEAGQRRRRAEKVRVPHPMPRAERGRLSWLIRKARRAEGARGEG